MTKLTKEQRQELEAKIREACPHLYQDGHSYNFGGECPRCKKAIVDKHCWKAPQLQDVLIAMAGIPRDVWNYGFVQTKSKRILSMQKSVMGEIVEEADFDLTKDYHHQSDPFFLFLYSILFP